MRRAGLYISPFELARTSFLKRRRCKMNQTVERPINETMTSAEKRAAKGSLLLRNRPRNAAVNNVKFIETNAKARFARVLRRQRFPADHFAAQIALQFVHKETSRPCA